MRNVSDKILDRNKTHILCSITFSRKLALYEIMWKKMAEHAGHRWQNKASLRRCDFNARQLRPECKQKLVILNT
jgi:hypothetical protein